MKLTFELNKVSIEQKNKLLRLAITQGTQPNKYEVSKPTPQIHVRTNISGAWSKEDEKLLWTEYNRHVENDRLQRGTTKKLAKMLRRTEDSVKDKIYYMKQVKKIVAIKKKAAPVVPVPKVELVLESIKKERMNDVKIALNNAITLGGKINYKDDGKILGIETYQEWESFVIEVLRKERKINKVFKTNKRIVYADKTMFFRGKE